MYKIPRYTISLVRERSVSVEDHVIRGSATARDVFVPMFAGLDREQLMMMGLDAKHKVIGINLVSVGTLTSSLVCPREVFKPAVLMSAAAILIAHNHPSSGSVEPSPEDHALTHRLVKAGECLGIPLLDHLVLGDVGAFFSFADHGVMKGDL